jgi:hypothetical protein
MSRLSMTGDRCRWRTRTALAGAGVSLAAQLAVLILTRGEHALLVLPYAVLVVLGWVRHPSARRLYLAAGTLGIASACLCLFGRPDGHGIAALYALPHLAMITAP